MAKQKTGTTTTALDTTQETDLTFALQVGKAVAGFLKRAAEFFSKADDLEKKAEKTAVIVSKLKLPTSAEEDVALQTILQKIAVGQKVVEAHWDGTDLEPGITRLLFRLHRRTTTKRDVAIKLLKDAAKHGNDLHNEFVRLAKERAAAETRRLQAIEDEKARVAREAELEALEQEALEQESKSEDLSEREQKFVSQFVLHDDWKDEQRQAQRAAVLAGFKRVPSIDSEKITNAIVGARAAIAARQQAAALAAAPVNARTVSVEADVKHADGAKDVTRRSAKVTNPELLVAAVFEGKVPRDVLMIDEARLNEYARSLKQIINRWPGVELVEDTKVQ